MTTFDKTLDMQGSGKLKEFRALRTKLPNVYFAKGAPLHTVHLPKTLGTLELIENTNLSNIITDSSKVQICDLVDGVAVYKDPDEYRGLYIEGITDYTTDKLGTGHTLSSLVIEGGNLGFDSYKLLANLVNLKATATEDNTLRMSLKDVVWTPYTLVEAGEAYNSNLPIGKSYTKLNDHSKFDEYIYDENTWEADTLNGLIYIYDSVLGLANPIKDLSILNSIINLYVDKNG